MSMGKKTIEGFREFHSQVKEIVEKLTQDQQLAIRATANPILAIEELGYSLSPSVKKQIERRVRFTARERKRLNDLEKQICKEVGREVDLVSVGDIEKALFTDCKIKKPGRIALKPPDIAERGKMMLKGEKDRWIDPLERLKDSHPVVPLLLKYREIDFGRPGFASKQEYEMIKSGKVRFPVSSIKIRFPDHMEHHEEEGNGA